MIALPLFSQRDEKWRSKKLGTSLLTLGTSGCLVTCLADICSYYGKETDPSKIDDELIRVNGFANQNLYIWGSISKVYPDISEPKRVQTPNPVTSTQFASIDAELIAGRPVIIEVDFVPATASIDMHFVVLIGKDENGNYVIADPWWGDTATLQRYGDPAKTIQQYIFTFGAIPPQATTQPTDEQAKALTVITEAFKALPDDDLYKPGNLEGFVRGIVGEHKNYKNYETKSNQFDALIEKWFTEWHLAEDPNKSHLVLIEEEAGKLLTFEDNADKYRSGIEALVGHFDSDDALLKALGAEKEDKQGLVDQVGKLNDIITDLKKKQNIKFSFNFLGYSVKVFNKEEVKK
jgi:hypothetical protein